MERVGASVFLDGFSLGNVGASSIFSGAKTPYDIRTGAYRNNLILLREK